MLRNCIGCGQIDDHPRHVIGLPGGEDVFWHNDCHARSSAACSICAAVVESAGKLKGDALRAHIEENDPGAEAAAALNAIDVNHFHLED